MSTAKTSDGRTLPENSEDNQGQEVALELSEPRVYSARWFREGVAVYETAKQAAYDIGVDQAYLSHQCTGLKPVNMSHLERMRRANLKAFQRIVYEMAREAKLVVVPQNEISLSSDQRELLAIMRAMLGEFWPPFRDQLAKTKFLCDADLIDEALDFEARRK